MDEGNIIDMLFNRQENVISEMQKKYGAYCHSIAYNILQNNEDSEECVNDTYIRVWNSIPPNRPNCLLTFLGKITRNLALNRYEEHKALKRGGGVLTVVFDELFDCIPSSSDVEHVVNDLVLQEILNDFLSSLDRDSRIVFLQRYWYFLSIKQIAKESGFTQSKVKMILLRARNKLKEILEKEGLNI